MRICFRAYDAHISFTPYAVHFEGFCLADKAIKARYATGYVVLFPISRMEQELWSGQKMCTQFVLFQKILILIHVKIPFGLLRIYLEF
jgi:hypothetical protein